MAITSMKAIIKNSETSQNSICVVAIAKEEEPFLDEWLVYHKLLGIDHFIIYDDHPALPLTSFLSPHRGYTTVVEWQANNENTERQGNQLKAYVNAWQEYIMDYEWVAFLDIDEYIVLRKHTSIHEFLKEFDNINAISLNWHLFGHNGFVQDPERLISTSLTRRMYEPSSECKTITRTSAIDGMISPHFCNLKAGNRVDANKRIYNDEVYEGKTTIAHVNHYLCRSFMRWMNRVDRGNVNYKPEICPSEHKWRFDKKLCLERFITYIAKDKNEYVDDYMINFRYSIQENLARLNRNNSMLTNDAYDENFKIKLREKLNFIAQTVKANLNSVNGIGLFHGKAGIAIFLFHYSRFVDDLTYKETAEKLVENISEEITSDSPLNYAEGLSGYGFVIEYCVKQGFIKTDTNCVLEDVDLMLYYFLTKGGLKKINAYADLTGAGRYFISRLKNPFNNPYDECEHRNKEILNYISDSVYIEGLSFHVLLDVISFFSEAFNYVDDKTKIKKQLDTAINEFNSKMANLVNLSEYPENLQRTALLLIEVSENLRDNIYSDLAIELIEKFLKTPEPPIETTSLQDCIYNIQLQKKLKDKNLFYETILDFELTDSLAPIGGDFHDISLVGLSGLGLNLLALLNQNDFVHDLIKSNFT